MRTKSLLAVLALLLFTVPGSAQQPQRIRGTIASADGGAIVVKQAEGPDVTVKLADNLQVFAVLPGALADLKPGTYVGIGAMPQPDGSQKAVQVTIFAESQRGLGEGFRPWDRPNSTMTNGTVDTTVTGVNGPMLTVKYKDGEQKIVVGPDATIRNLAAGDKSELKPGAQIAIVRLEKTADGALSTSRISVGRNGVVPQ